MSKAVIYVTSRTGERRSPSVRENAWSHFVSTGGMVGSPGLAADIANKALEQGMTVTLKDNQDGTVTIRRLI